MMLAIEICEKCKNFDDRSDIPNLWCNKLGDLINGCEMSELAEAGCQKIKTILEFESLPICDAEAEENIREVEKR